MECNEAMWPLSPCDTCDILWRTRHVDTLFRRMVYQVAWAFWQTRDWIQSWVSSQNLRPYQMQIASTFWILDHQLGQSMYIPKHPGLMWIDLYLIAEATVLSLLFLLLMTHYAGPVLFIAIVLADILIFLLGLFFAMGIFFDPFNTVGCSFGVKKLLHCSTSTYFNGDFSVEKHQKSLWHEGDLKSVL